MLQQEGTEGGNGNLQGLILGKTVIAGGNQRKGNGTAAVFQGKAGCYDPLDAMRRDAHREIFLVIRRQLALARQEATQTQHKHDE